MDGGVRVKHMTLNPEHWDLLPVVGDKESAWAWLKEHGGAGYESEQRRTQLPRSFG